MPSFLRLFVVILLCIAAPASWATFHLITIEEIFSNADGSIQYIVLHGDADLQEKLATHSIQTNGPGGPQTYTFQSNLPDTATSGRRILIATQGFAALNLVTPDYTVPNGFVPTANGTVNYAGFDQWTYSALPTDGVNALYLMGAVSPNLATNFAGASAAVIPVPTKLVITSVNGGLYPLLGQPFNVAVQAQDASGAPGSVLVDMAVNLSVHTGTGLLAGSLACVILATTNSCTVAGVFYSLLDTGVILTASCGCPLAAGDSAPFNVIQFAGPTPILMKSGSRKTHGVAGQLDLPL